MLNVVAVIMLAGCDRDPQAPDAMAAEVIGITWLLEDLDHGGVIDNSHLTLQFGTLGNASGSSGCNQYRTGYSLDGQHLTLASNIAVTRKACAAQALMYQEQAYLDLLPEMQRIQIDQTGALVLSGADGQQLLYRATE